MLERFLMKSLQHTYIVKSYTLWLLRKEMHERTNTIFLPELWSLHQFEVRVVTIITR